VGIRFPKPAEPTADANAGATDERKPAFAASTT
jgi:hypothetical protein